MTSICLTEERLTDFLEGRLSAAERNKVEDHLSTCDRCLELASTFRRVSSAGSIYSAGVVPTAATKRVLAALAHLNPGNPIDRMAARTKAISLRVRGYLEQSGYAGSTVLEPIRGDKNQVADDLIMLNKTFSGLETQISIEKIDPETANVSVVITKADADKIPVRVSLMADDREIASYLIDVGAGGACFESMPFGRYALTFTHNSVVIGRYVFQIKETGNGGQQDGR